MILWILILLLVAVAAKPNVPSVILSADDISPVASSSSANVIFQQTIEAHKTNIIHDYSPPDNDALSGSYLKQDQETNSLNEQLVGKYVATPYGHHGISLGHFGQLFNQHHAPTAPYFWYPPVVPLPPAAPPAPAPAPPAQQASTEPMPVTIPIIPFAAQVLNQLFWMPLEQLLINVNQSLFQAPKDEKKS